MVKFQTLLLATSFVCATLLPAANAANNATSSDALAAVIASRSAEDKARDAARHPAATLAFFQVEPGMTVAEGLPGRGWYTKILANYLGEKGAIHGVNYADRMWPMFSFATPEIIATRTASTAMFPAMVGKFTDNGIAASGFTFETVPDAMAGSVDRVLLIRALHNLNRFEAKAGTRSKALAAISGMLKPDGMIGVVQHRAPETADDASTDGSRGYLKQSAVIAMFKENGFELVASSEINANPADQPGADAIVWRLPPSLRGTEEGSEAREKVLAIGESDRMTLLFRRAK